MRLDGEIDNQDSAATSVHEALSSPWPQIAMAMDAKCRAIQLAFVPLRNLVLGRAKDAGHEPEMVTTHRSIRIWECDTAVQRVVAVPQMLWLG